MDFKYLRTNIDVRNDLLEEQLNHHGKIGWELVSCVERVVNNSLIVYDCIFKMGYMNPEKETNKSE